MNQNTVSTCLMYFKFGINITKANLWKLSPFLLHNRDLETYHMSYYVPNKVT